jgi:hypothetical protein
MPLVTFELSRRARPSQTAAARKSVTAERKWNRHSKISETKQRRATLILHETISPPREKKKTA